MKDLAGSLIRALGLFSCDICGRAHSLRMRCGCPNSRRHCGDGAGDMGLSFEVNLRIWRCVWEP